MILDDIVAATRVRVAKEKEVLSLDDLRAQVANLPVRKDFPFEKALQAQDFNFICEVKKASPSKGIIAEDFPYIAIAQDYERAGAACISVLTEPDFFKGSPQYLQEIVETVSIPVIRKDFIIDEYQIYQAKLWGASAILLICACLTLEQLKRFRELADSLGLSALVEAHDEEEMRMAIACGARIIGVNNRNLKDFTVDVTNSIRLRQLAPEDIIFVSESGLESAEDIQTLRDHGIQAALMGETLMRSQDKVATLAALYGPLRCKAERKDHKAGCRAGRYIVASKFCGIQDEETIPVLVGTHPDYIGFVFAPSKRQVSPERATTLTRALHAQTVAVGSPHYIKTVGVFVNEDLDRLCAIADQVGLDVIQLHGDEDEDYVEALKEKTDKEVWKAVSVRSLQDVNRWAYSDVDRLLFDAYSPSVRGGSGAHFDWELLKDFHAKPFMLAGGLNEFNLARAIRTVKPAGIDMSSGLEVDGRKDTATIRRVGAIIDTIRHSK